MKRTVSIIIVLLVAGAAVAGCGSGSSGQSRSPAGGEPVTPPIGTDATLASLTIADTDLEQAFQQNLHDYTASTSYLNRQTTITALTSDPAAGISINGIAVERGMPSEPVLLTEGSNLVTINVVAEDGIAQASYSVDISRRYAADLAQANYLKALNAGSGDRFGGAVALSGSTVAVAAVEEDGSATSLDGSDDSAPGAGAVYVFRRDTAGSWVQEAYLKAGNAGNGDGFGRALALDGNTLAVGAWHEDSATTGVEGAADDNSAIDSGAVYVFVRDETGLWNRQAYIKPANTGAFDGFGAALALDGDVLVAGAPFEDSAATGIDGPATDDSSSDSGAAYVFARDATGTWSQQAYVKSLNSDPGDNFGHAVALSGTTFAVGAPGEASKATGIGGTDTNNSWSSAGAVYLFTSDAPGQWQQSAYVKASNTGNGDRFGAALALHRDSLVVGAPNEDSAATGVNGFENDNKALNSGAAYVFSRAPDGTWSQDAYVKASNTGSQDEFGSSVAVDDTLMVLGALDDSAATQTNGDDTDNGLANSGAAYLFSRQANGTWSQQAYLKPLNADIGDRFGAALGLDGALLLLGAPFEDSGAAGVGGDPLNNAATDAGAAYIIY